MPNPLYDTKVMMLVAQGLPRNKALEQAKSEGYTEDITAEDLEGKSHAELLSLRNRLSPKDPLQDKLGPLEHQAFAREWVKEDPILGAASLAIATPLYTLAKMSGLMGGRSQAGAGEIMAGYKGIGQGLGIVK